MNEGSGHSGAVLDAGDNPKPVPIGCWLLERESHFLM